MKLTGPGESVDRVMRRPIPSHPLAVPPEPGTFGVWQVRRNPANPIGYVLNRSLEGGTVYDCYAHCRDTDGGRPWLRTFDTLNSAVAWLIQNEASVHAFNARHLPEPDVWPA